jgi:hypothetical protein
MKKGLEVGRGELNEWVARLPWSVFLETCFLLSVI